MALTPDTRLGPYEILGALGGGGMGEVYRARDTRLGRDVAIKALPAAFAADPARLSRFRREAQTLASAAYMSPEQARGKPVDRRTDVWSFGCVLFECLSGRAPFVGETVSDLIARILEREPDWSALPAGTPPGIREILRRCLRKNAE